MTLNSASIKDDIYYVGDNANKFYNPNISFLMIGLLCLTGQIKYDKLNK